MIPDISVFWHLKDRDGLSLLVQGVGKGSENLGQPGNEKAGINRYKPWTDVLI